MPYRRLPNTDKARLRAMKKALEMGKTVSPVNLAFSQATLQKVRYFLPVFEQTMIQQQHAFNNQIDRSKEYIDMYKKAKMYISHFIQVLNMAAVRGDIPAEMKELYCLKPKSKRVPTLNTEQEVITWGMNIIKGESDRLAKGGNPLTNPTIALVKVRFEKFYDAYRKQKSLQEISSRALGKVADLRQEADDIILNIWNEVENKFDKYPQNEKRLRSSEYGLIYVYRKNEKRDLQEIMEEDEDCETLTLQEARSNTFSSEKLQYALSFSEQKID